MTSCKTFLSKLFFFIRKCKTTSWNLTFTRGNLNVSFSDKLEDDAEFEIMGDVSNVTAEPSSSSEATEANGSKNGNSEAKNGTNGEQNGCSNLQSKDRSFGN